MLKSPLLALAVGIVAGAITMFVGLWLLFAIDYCAGLSIFDLSRLDKWSCSEVGRYRRIQGIWVDGFEEARFLPNRISLPQPVPNSDTILIIDEAAKNFIYQSLPEQPTKVARNIVAIEFLGNELWPDHPKLYNRYFVVRQVLSTRLVRSEPN
jgi:hypothetical protein